MTERLTLQPRLACGVATANQCPVLRVCPVCGRDLATRTGRVRHQNSCRDGTFNVAFAEVQHEHEVAFHAPKRGRPTG